MNTVAGLGFVVVWLLNLAIGVGLLIYTIQLLFAGEFLWFALMFFIGIGVITWLLGILQMPFIVPPAYFAEKVATILHQSSGIAAHSDDDTNKESIIRRKLAIYFMAAYGLNVVSVLLNAADYPSWRWGDYILWPFLWVISQVIVIGLVVGVYLKLRRGKFFYPRKKLFLTTTLKVLTIILVILSAIFFLSGIWGI